MRQQLIAPGFNINQKNINPQDNIPKNINDNTKKRILKTNSYDTIVTAKYKDVASSIILKKEKRQF